MEPAKKLLNKNFVLLWTGQTVSTVGTMAYNIATMFWILEATGSAALMGFLVMASAVPGILLSPIGGTLADNFSRRTIIIVSDAVEGVALLTLTGLLYFRPEANDLILYWIFGVAIASGIIGSFFRPAINASIPDLVPKEQLARANSLMQFSGRLGTLAGLLFGGVIYGFFGPLMLFFINGLSFLLSAVSECFITIPQDIPEKKSAHIGESFRNFARDTGEGFRYIWKRIGLRNLILGSATWNFFIIPYRVLLPVFVGVSLAVEKDWYGFWYGAMIGAMVVGSMIGLAVFGTIKATGPVRLKIMVGLPICIAVVLFLLGMFPSAPVATAIFLIVGFNGTLFDMSAMIVLQTSTASRIRGRVFSVLGTLVAGLAPFAMGLSGVVADMLNKNIPLLFAACGVILLAITLTLSSSRQYRIFISTDADDDDSASPEETSESPTDSSEGGEQLPLRT